MAANLSPEEVKQYVNLDEGLGRVRGNKKIFKRMLGLFLNSAEIPAFEEAMAAKDYAKAGEVSHGIKGMTGNLGLTAVFEQSNQLMVELRQDIVNEELLAQYRKSVEITTECVKDILAEWEQEGL